jgi:hypothetical protein
MQRGTSTRPEANRLRSVLFRKAAARVRLYIFPTFIRSLMHSWDASALIAVSLTAVIENSRSGPESIVLRLGVEALDRVYDQLDEATWQLARFHKKHVRVIGGREGPATMSGERWRERCDVAQRLHRHWRTPSNGATCPTRWSRREPA